MPLKNGRTTAAIQQILIGSVIPAGSVAPFGGSVVPDGWLLCDGSAVSRTTYSNLFSALSTAHGQGDGATTFNLPDYRGQFLRGRVNISTVTGSGTADSNQAIFTAHGINRTGFRVRLSSGTLSGLAVSTDYFAIVVNANTLAFASSQANALSNTRIAISGANSAVITQFEDPDASSRTALNVGGNSGNSIGAVQTDGFQTHRHGQMMADNGGNYRYEVGTANNGGNFYSGAGNAVGYFSVLSGYQTMTQNIYSEPGSGNAKHSAESRPQNVTVNYIIKF